MQVVYWFSVIDLFVNIDGSLAWQVEFVLIYGLIP